jgi:hypothetical protein
MTMRALEVFLNGRYLLTAGLHVGFLHSFVELDRGVPRYFLQGGDFTLRNKGELVFWSTPEINVGDEVAVRIIENDQAPTEPSFRGGPRQLAERSSGGGYHDVVGTYYDALANPSQYLTSAQATGGLATRALEVFHNGLYVVTAGIAGNAGYIDWFVEIHGGLLNHVVRGIDFKTNEHVDWQLPPRWVGDEVGVRIIETEQISPASRRFGAQRSGE